MAQEPPGLPEDEFPPPLRRWGRERLVLPRPWLIIIGVLSLIGIIGILLLLVFLLLRACAPSGPAVLASPTVQPTPVAVETPLPVAFTPTPSTPTPTATFTPLPPTPTPTLPTEIAVGGYVRVVATAGVNFRESPGVDQALIRLLENGEVLKVVGGPQEVGEFTWWQLEDRREKKVGWAAESTADTALLEPTLPPE